MQSGAAGAERAFTIENDAFVRDGEEVQILAGSIHYFRVHPQVSASLPPPPSYTFLSLFPANCVAPSPQAHCSMSCCIKKHTLYRASIKQDNSYLLFMQYWEDRLRRLQALGLNTVQTLIPWNVHEGAEGEFTWEGTANLEEFLHVAQRLGLMVMLRLGPYICAGQFHWAPNLDHTSMLAV